MIKIIETNIILDKDNIMHDHQSRVIEVKSWDEYVNCYEKNIEMNKTENDFKSVTGLVECSLSKYGDITELKHDDFHLSCYHVMNNGFHKTLRLAYRVWQED